MSCACADTLVDNLTVQEMLLYTAEMKLEMVVTMAEKRKKVEDLLKQLALDGCRNVRIGSNMQRGISGMDPSVHTSIPQSHCCPLLQALLVASAPLHVHPWRAKSCFKVSTCHMY